MTRKRKKAQTSNHDSTEDSRKRIKSNDVKSASNHPTLCLYYSQVLTLRAYLIANIPGTSKLRRRRILAAHDSLLDQTLIGTTTVKKAQAKSIEPSRSKDFETFSQKVGLSAGSSIGEGTISQSDIVNFAIWLLFHRIYRHTHRPPHLLCHGYQRIGNRWQSDEDHGALAGIPGIISYYPNSNVDILKNAFWVELLGLLGHEGDRIMLDLILKRGIFTAVNGGRNNYSQLSGRELQFQQYLSSRGDPRTAFDRNTLSRPRQVYRSISISQFSNHRCSTKVSAD